VDGKDEFAHAMQEIRYLDELQKSGFTAEQVIEACEHEKEVTEGE
jgi:hypothetical protein